MIEGPNGRYQIATSAFHCILSGSLNEAAYNAYNAGVMEIRTAGSSCSRPQLLLDQKYFFLTLDRTLVFLSFRRQPVDSRNEEAANSPRNTIYSLKAFLGSLA